jgi:carbon-monoxide dehydrogenase small subunit
MKKPVEFILNGRRVRVEVDPNELLLDVLREKLGIYSPKYACGDGECGACVVLMDGKAVLSCLLLAVEVEGREITTLEGLDGDNVLEKLREKFSENHAVQCGYCTPGFLLASRELLLRKLKSPVLTRSEIKDHLKGNLCRCTGYLQIVEAVEMAFKDLTGKEVMREEEV